jgi:hypothetical protein
MASSTPWNYNTKRRLQNQNLPMQRQFEYEKLMRFLRNRYTYQFKTDEQKKKYRFKLPWIYLERIVAEYGRAAIYEHEDYGIAIYKATMAGNLNIFGQPNTYFLYTSNGTPTIKVQADDPKLIILMDNFSGFAYTQLAYRYGDMLGKIRESVMTNVAAMRTPFLVQAPKEKVLEVRMALEAMNESVDVIVDPNLEFSETIKVVDLKTPDRLKTLEDEYNTTISKFMEEIGFSSNSVDKKERLVAAEAEDDEGMLKAFDSEPYMARLAFVELMEEKFGIQLNLVKANEDLYMKIEPAKPTDKPKDKNNG